MTLKEYLEEATSNKNALINGKSHNKNTNDRPTGSRGRDSTGDAFLGKKRNAIYRSDENDASKGSDQNRNTGNFFTTQRSANKYTADRPENGKRRRDETPSYYTSQKSHNKFDDSPLGNTGSERSEGNHRAFLSKLRNSTYRSDENDVSNGSPSKERKGKDLDAFTGINRKKQD